MHRRRGLRGRIGEQLHLRELMHAVEPLARLTRGPRLGPEAVRYAYILNWKAGLVDGLPRVHPAQGDLGGADERQVGLFDRIDLRLRAARVEADPLRMVFRARSGGDRRESVALGDLEGVRLRPMSNGAPSFFKK